MSKLPIAVIGAGAIGRTHIDRARTHDAVTPVAIADPTDDGRRYAEEVGLPWFADYREMLTTVKPQGVVVATPNSTHAEIANECLNAGAAVIVEKPIADSLAEARSIVDTAATTGLPALVGHHRRYHPVISTARRLIRDGAIGRPVTATVISTWRKSDAYYDVAWRREPGGGPVLINLIHDIDLLLHFYGEVEQVQAVSSNGVRGFGVEDTAAAILRFRNGALATCMVSDAVVAPWEYNLGAGEVERFPKLDINALYLSGTEGSIALPRLEVWTYQGPEKHWEAPISLELTPPLAACPYSEQLRHFAAVLDGKEEPVCSALDGLRTLEATIAVLEASHTGAPVVLKS